MRKHLSGHIDRSHLMPGKRQINGEKAWACSNIQHAQAFFLRCMGKDQLPPCLPPPVIHLRNILRTVALRTVRPIRRQRIQNFILIHLFLHDSCSPDLLTALLPFCFCGCFCCLPSFGLLSAVSFPRLLPTAASLFYKTCFFTSARDIPCSLAIRARSSYSYFSRFTP